MADSWEQHEEEQVEFKPAPKPSLNPAAASFSFNPSAGSFVPGQFASTTQRVESSDASVSPPVAAIDANGARASGPSDVGPSGPTSTDTIQRNDAEDNEAMEENSNSVPSKSATEPSAETLTKETKNLAIDEKETGGVTVPDDDSTTETPAQKEARYAEVKAALEDLDKEDPREHLNIIFIGHVDAGKSTTAGQILFLTGGVDDRTIEKYEREAKEKNRESWYMAYIMDTNEEERAKGKTVEVGRAYFETPKKRFTILDAPGHKSFVPNMISGASQADVGVLVISARKGEFETGFERGGQTREHAQLAKTLGVTKLIVVINKMDDHSIIEGSQWSKARYDEIESKLTPFLRGCGYNPKKDLVWLPISGLMGHNMKDRVDEKICPWFKGPSLFEALDNIDPMLRDPFAPFRMPIVDKYKDMGTVIMGKSEAGLVKKNDSLIVMPNKAVVKVTTIWRDEKEVNAARPGENLRLRVAGVEEEDISAGFVVSSRFSLVPVVTQFEAQVAILDLLEHKPILAGGYRAVLHIHSIVEECEVLKLVAVIDAKTKEKKKAKFVKSGSICIARIAVDKPICVEAFETVPQLGRFTLRDEGRTIAIGKVTRVPKKGAKSTAE